MKPPRIRFPREDYPDLSGERLEKFLRNLTAVSDFITKALSGDLSFADNMRSAEREVVFSALPFRFKHDAAWRPAGLQILAADDISGGTPAPVSLGNPAWALAKGEIVISDVLGITTGKKYRLKLRIDGG